MTQPRDLDPIIASWLDDGPIDLPADTRRAIVVGLRTQPRVRRMASLRGLPVTTFSRLATAAGIVLAVGVLSVFVLSNRAGGSGATPSASASPAPSASPRPTSSASPTASPMSTADWLPFHSARYGYDAKHPPYLTATASSRQWTIADQSDWLSPANDRFRGPVGITVSAVTLPAGTSRDAWIASLFGSPDPCSHALVDLGTKEVDGYPVVFYSEHGVTCGGTSAFVLVGDRFYFFFIGLPNYEPTLEAFLSTVRFQPQTPGSPGPS